MSAYVLSEFKASWYTEMCRADVLVGAKICACIGPGPAPGHARIGAWPLQRGTG